MKKCFDLVAIGEYLVDFTPAGLGQGGRPLFEMNPGGAPVNCLTACARLGGQTALISAVGQDLFGDYLTGCAAAEGIDLAGLQRTEACTTLAFVSLDAAGEREFAFVREPGADTQIKKEKIDLALLEHTACLHFGSLSLCREPSRSATAFAVDYAGAHGALISYDANYRPRLWRSQAEAVEQMLWGLSKAGLVKLSLEELALLTGCPVERPETGMAQVLDMGVKELYVTAGSRGAYYAGAGGMGFVPGFPANVVDTTGCGDAFLGAILFLNSREEKRSMEEKTRFANAVGALCAEGRGGMSAMPGPEQARKRMGA